MIYIYIYIYVYTHIQYMYRIYLDINHLCCWIFYICIDSEIAYVNPTTLYICLYVIFIILIIHIFSLILKQYIVCPYYGLINLDNMYFMLFCLAPQHTVFTPTLCKFVCLCLVVTSDFFFFS